MPLKLAVALGLREKTEKDFSNMLSDMLSKFKNKQGIFQGQRNTFSPFEGFPDQPEKRTMVKVASTVKEQLDWFKNHTKDYMTNVLSIERTNATGVFAKLIVDGELWGEFSTLELLRLKGILDSKLRAMIQELPIRKESEIWNKTTDSVYEGREIYETPIFTGQTKTTHKRTVIVSDPHIKEAPNRPPITQVIDEQQNTGTYTSQSFSGEITNMERAKMEVAYNNLYKAVIAALEEANAAEVVTSNLGDKVLNYLFR